MVDFLNTAEARAIQALNGMAGAESGIIIIMTLALVCLVGSLGAFLETGFHSRNRK